MMTHRIPLAVALRLARWQWRAQPQREASQKYAIQVERAGLMTLGSRGLIIASRPQAGKRRRELAIESAALPLPWPLFFFFFFCPALATSPLLTAFGQGQGVKPQHCSYIPVSVHTRCKQQQLLLHACNMDKTQHTNMSTHTMNNCIVCSHINELPTPTSLLHRLSSTPI